MQKIVINKSFENFSVSYKAFRRLRELGQPDVLQESDRGEYWPEGETAREPSLNRCGRGIPRNDHQLVQVVELLGAEANGLGAELRVVAVPDGVKWLILQSNGVETVAEQHRTWG